MVNQAHLIIKCDIFFAFSSDDDGTNFHLFHYLYRLLRVGGSSSMATVTLATLNRLLLGVSKVYDVRGDHVTGGSQSAWLKTVAADVLRLEGR